MITAVNKANSTGKSTNEFFSNPSKVVNKSFTYNNDSFNKNCTNFKGYHTSSHDAKWAKIYLGMSESGVEREVLGKKGALEGLSLLLTKGSISGRSDQSKLDKVLADMNEARKESLMLLRL